MLKTLILPVLFAGALCAADMKSEFLEELASIEKKYVSLAEAIPADKYSYRPGEGARSVSEVLMHVSAANNMLPGFVGMKSPNPASRDLEKKVTDKAEVLDSLRKSFEFLRGTAAIAAEPDKTVKVFGGREMSQRYFLNFVNHHLHEHLGQLIAYARASGVTPPWSQR